MRATSEATSTEGDPSLGVAPEALEAARWLAWRALRRGRFELAGTLLRGCAALDPHDAWTWRALAARGMRTRDVDGARDAIREFDLKAMRVAAQQL